MPALGTNHAATTRRTAGVDLQWMQGEGLLGRDTVAEWVGALEREPMASLPRVHASVAGRLGGPEHRAFRDALAKWTDERLRALGATREAREQVEERIVNPRERPEMAQTFQEWLDANTAEAVAEGIAEGLAQAKAQLEAQVRTQLEAQVRAQLEAQVRAQAEAQAEARADARQRRLVVRQASRRFGVGTGERLTELVEPMGAEELERVGDAVVECGTGEELLERASNGVSSSR